MRRYQPPPRSQLGTHPLWDALKAAAPRRSSMTPHCLSRPANRCLVQVPTLRQSLKHHLRTRGQHVTATPFPRPRRTFEAAAPRHSYTVPRCLSRRASRRRSRGRRHPAVLRLSSLRWPTPLEHHHLPSHCRHLIARRRPCRPIVEGSLSRFRTSARVLLSGARRGG